jgi:hypothetical protein
MSDPISDPQGNPKQKELQERARRLWLRLKRTLSTLPRSLVSIGAMGAVLTLLAVVYLGYDLAKARLSPCEAVYQQTAVGMKTRIKFLKTEGELQLGREQLTDLDERAQMAALNLKTCCTVLDAGRLDPEQFLQCKGSARAYEARLEDIADLVRKAVKDSLTTGSIAANATTPPAPAAAPPQLKEKIANKVAAAKAVSRSFNHEVVAVRKAQALESLKATPPQHVTIEAQEAEPNDNGLATNEITLGKWITGSVGAPKDADYFAFTTPKTHRDWIRIELQNRSTTLEPRLEMFDAEKTSRGEVHKTTNGADLNYAFVARPATAYVVRVSNYYGESTGVYLLRVVATKAYDAHEPNDDVLNAKTISIADPVSAGIMDGKDVDYFVFTSGDKEGVLRASVQNRSTALHPEIAAFNSSKALIGSGHNTTAGGDTSYTFKVKPNTTYYVRARDYYSNAAGNYTLMVSEVPPADG